MNSYKSSNQSTFKKFFLFIMASVVFWFMTKLSKEYDNTIDYPVVYKNLPANKLLQKEPWSRIDIHVKTSGFKLIAGYLFPREIELDASNLYSKRNNDYYFLLSQQRLAIQKQLDAAVEIDHFILDSIFLNLGKLETKRVPIKLNTNLLFATGYDIDGQIHIKPDSVDVSAPESILDTIRFINSKVLSKTEISRDLSEVVTLENFKKENNVRISKAEVEVNASVQKFTESTIELPIEIINLPEEMKINTFPKNVKVTYKVALSKFNQINPSSFVITCDYNTSVKNDLSYLIPKLQKHSDLVKSVKISPQKIDFFIEK